MFRFEQLVPGLTETTSERFSEAADQPGIKNWRNQRAAETVRKTLAAANRTLALHAGDTVVWNDHDIPTDIYLGSRGILLGFRGRQVLVRFPGESRYKHVRGLNSEPVPDWQGFVQAGVVTPDRG